MMATPVTGAMRIWECVRTYLMKTLRSTKGGVGVFEQRWEPMAVVVPPAAASAQLRTWRKMRSCRFGRTVKQEVVE